MAPQPPATLVLAACLALSYLVVRLGQRIITSRRQARQAREWGCQPAVVEPARWPLQIDRVREALSADTEKRFPPWLVSRAAAMGGHRHTWQMSIFGSRGFFTADPENVQAILATQFGTFDLGPRRRGGFWPMLGNGIFSQEGAAWKHSRDMMRPQFTRDQVSDLELEERHLQHLMLALDAHLPSDSPHSASEPGWTGIVDLQDLFFRLTLDSATEFLLGESADSQLQHIPGFAGHRNSAEALHQIDFATAFDRGQRGLAVRGRLGPLYWAWSSREFRKSIREVHSFVDYYVQAALARTASPDEKKGAGGEENKYVFLDALALATRDPVELRSQTLHILLAGRDTTASMLGWLFFLLARDPARYAKLRAAVLAEFGPYEASTEKITFAALKGCQYLQWCNNETLRLFPVVPINERHAHRDAKLPVGGGEDGRQPVFVKKGENVGYSVHVMHRRKDLWGEDADEFRPERWEGRRVGWEYVPFNGGPRICIGQQFALTEASYVTVRLVQRFDQIRNMDPDAGVWHNLTLTNCSANGVKVALHASAK